MDFNLLLGNTVGIVMVFIESQTNGSYYNDFTLPALREAATSSLAGYKESLANSQGIYTNSANNRPRIEREIVDNITKIGGTYNFRKRFFFNSSLGQSEAVDILVNAAQGITSLINHADTTEMLSTNGGENLIDALIGGTEA